MTEFKTTEELFPRWMTARVVLQMWINSVEGWGAEFDQASGSANLYPRSRFDISGLVPPEDWVLVQQLFGAAAGGLGQRLNAWLDSLPTMLPGSNAALHVTASEANRIEMEMEQEGRGTLRDRLAKSLGLRDDAVSSFELRTVLIVDSP